MSLAFVSVALQVFCTLAIFTFLWRDNPVYKLVEHLFVGVATGWYIVTQYRDVFLPNLCAPLARGLAPVPGSEPPPRWQFLAIPLVLGLLLLTRYLPSIAYLSRWSMAAIVGTFAGLAIVGFASGDLFLQTRANLVPIVDRAAWRAFVAGPGLESFLGLLTNPVMVVGVIAVLVYFFFSVPHKGAVGAVSKLGVWFLMVSFGASYGNTVMARISLFIGRADFLLSGREPLSLGGRAFAVPHALLTLLFGALIIAGLALWHRRTGGAEES